MDIRSTKENWHKKRINKKHQFSRGASKASNEENSSYGAPTSVVDVADSSDDRYSKRSIRSFSYKDDFEVDDSDQQMKAANFKELQKSSTGSHFIFNSEKQWEEHIIDKSEACTYFTMNLNLITTGIRTIPFYRRMDFNSSMFSKEQLKRMNNEAEIKEKEYQCLLENHNKQKQKANCKSVENKMNVSQPKVSENTEMESSKSQNDKSNELDELLNLATPTSAGNAGVLGAQDVEDLEKHGESINSIAQDGKVPETQNSVFGKENIEEWLDGILDE